MTEAVALTRTPAFEARLRKRYAAERRFRLVGLAAILFSVAVLVFLLVTMTINGIGGFQRATLKVPVDFTAVGLNETVSQAVAIVQPQANSQRVISFTYTQPFSDQVAYVTSPVAGLTPTAVQPVQQQQGTSAVRGYW